MAKRTKKRKSSIEDRLVDLTEVNSPTIITVYGRPGSGKTTFASTGPKPQLFIDVKDKGTDSAKHTDLEEGDITVFQLKEFDDIYEIYDYIVDNPDTYKSVVIDHMTALQDLSHEKAMKDEKKTTMSQRLYGHSSSYLKEVIALYKDLTDLGITPIFITQDRTDSEGDGEDQLAPEVGPALMPSIARSLSASSRIIGHAYQQERVEKTADMKVDRTIEYRLRLGPDPYYLTKVTRPKGTYCPDYLVDPHYDQLMEIVNGEYTPPKPKRVRRKRRKSRK